jgi:hypothetical protein
MARAAFCISIAAFLYAWMTAREAERTRFDPTTCTVTQGGTIFGPIPGKFNFYCGPSAEEEYRMKHPAGRER